MLFGQWARQVSVCRNVGWIGYRYAVWTAHGCTITVQSIAFRRWPPFPRWLWEPVDLCPLNIHRERLLGAAAATALSIVPYTGAIMIPGFKKLNKIREKCAFMVTVVVSLIIRATAAKSTLADADVHELDAHPAQYRVQHLVRSALLSTAFSIAVAEQELQVTVWWS